MPRGATFADTAIDPLIVAGQFHDGVARGIGNAFYEQQFFDREGQLRYGAWADYPIPTALCLPARGIHILDIPMSPQALWRLATPREDAAQNG